MEDRYLFKAKRIDNGESLHVVEWAEKIGINAHCLLHRKDMGWTIEEILTTPLRGKRNVKC